MLWKFAAFDRILADEIRQVYECMELAAHGIHHIDLSKLNPEEMRAELLHLDFFSFSFRDLLLV